MSVSGDDRSRLLLDAEPPETVWAASLGSGRYSLASVPFFAYNLSFGDVVEASEQESGLVCRNVVEKSGHRTLRAVVPDHEDLEGRVAQELIAELARIGCGVEGFPPLLLAIDVPSETDLATAVACCEDAGVEWEYGDPQPDVS